MTRVVPSVPVARGASEVGAGVDGPLAALFAPRGVAVVGASRAAGKLGAAMARSLAGFGGHLALVNPRDDTMYPSVRAAAEDGPVDLALLCVPAPACAAAVAEAALGGVRAAVVCAGGFAESGAAGVRYQAELARVATGSGVRLLGPNTSGFLVPGRALTASFVPGAAAVPAGRVAVVAASGGVNHALAFLLAEAGHGVSVAVGLGNGADLTAADVLDHLNSEAAASAVALHVESVPDGRALAASVARLTRVRPVVALVVGRQDVGAFAASHTGALATSWRATRAALAQAGAVLVDDERELVDAVGALSLTRLRPAAAPGVGVLTAQAGPGLLLLDDLRGRRARVPELAAATRTALAEHLPPLTYQANPVDTGRPGPGFDAVLGALATDPEVDVVAGYALHEPDALDLVASAARFRATQPDTPLLLGVGGIGAEVTAARRALLRLGVPVADGPRGLAAMTGALLADARARHGGVGAASLVGAAPLSDAAPLDAPAADKWPDPGPGPWDEHRAKALLRALGVATMPGRACADRAEAHRALAELGGPVAVKLLDSSVLHKTELGGVRLGVATTAELDDALDALEAVGARRFLVELMSPPGPDLVLGARRDPVFGPVVLLGLGGTAAEALDDVALRLAPLGRADAAAMPDELLGRRLLDGWRGGPRLDRAALAELVVALGGFLAAAPTLAEIEINPLRVTVDGLVALDAVCLAAEPVAARSVAARSFVAERLHEQPTQRPTGVEEPDGGRAQ
ncbi:MAG TPA: acetate--CoA ligase family protein [Pseudonocardia sp.]|nr:acetate--CoA ligase family protein [Pseudonocardia sp.]